MVMLQLLVRLDGATTALDVLPGPTTAGAVLTALCTRRGLPAALAPQLCLSSGRNLWADAGAVIDPALHHFLDARLRGGLAGGKGGFGANLRMSGKTSMKQRAQNFGACRDLNGRRLSAVNNEVRLRKWLSDKEREKRDRLGDEYREPSGPAGLPGWFLGVPTWATEGYKRKATGELVAVGADTNERRGLAAKRKTAVCRMWLEARAGGRSAPAGAPPWWGCPKGRSCMYAHGEGELRAEAKLAAAEAAEEAARRRRADALDAYTRGLYVYGREGEDGGGSGGSGGGRSMLESVMQGLTAASSSAASASSSSGVAAVGSKRSRAAAGLDDDEVAVEGGEEEEEGGEGGDSVIDPTTFRFQPHSWLVCVSGTPDEVAVDYVAEPAPGQSSSSSSSTANSTEVDVAELRGVGDFATAAVLGVAVPVQLPPPGSSGAAAKSAISTTYSFEVELLTGGVVQLGWAAAGLFAPSSEDGDGVGDCVGSWGYDGARCMKWGGGDGGHAFGRPWAAGDVVGCSLSLRSGGGAVISYTLNGADLGAAFVVDSLPAEILAAAPTESLDLFPAVSVERGERVRVRVGALRHAVDGAIPVVQLAKRDDDAPAFPSPMLPPTSANAAAWRQERPVEKAVVEAAAPAAEGDNAPAAAPSQVAAASAPAEASSSVGRATTSAASPAPAPAPPAKELPLLNLDALSSARDIVDAGYSLEQLKAELAARGLKVGGTLEERAARLFAVKGLRAADVPVKLRGAGFPGSLPT